MSINTIQELDSSELGTQEYWEANYTREINNYITCPGDIGEIWFGEDSQFRVIDWMIKQPDILPNAHVLDLGCGNGMFLVELGREGFISLTGVDYSTNAVKFASSIAKDQSLNITYKIADLTQSQCGNLGKHDIVHDKGTYDAISLCPSNPKEKRAQYLNTVESLMRDINSIFIITSCNWTEEELLLSCSDKFCKYTTIPTPTFKFGGKVGSVVTTVVLKKKQF